MSINTIVISGINLFEGGPLSIYYDFLDSLIDLKLNETNTVVAFVHKIELFKKYEDTNIQFIELPDSRKNYIYRFYYEYVYFLKYSHKKNIDVWISLHDITPSVKANKIYTYCHNPSPFRKIGFFDFRMGIKNILFPLFYKWVYRINIKKTTNVIVQQNWIREEFEKQFKIKNVIVAKPNIKQEQYNTINKKCDKYSFFFPSYPRVFKNFQVICEAVDIIERNYPDLEFNVFLSLKGDENKYSKYLYKKYHELKNIYWLGILTRSEVFDYYAKVDCLLFPSNMETWGLPITEFKRTNKPMIVASLPYAYETVGDYNNVVFFNPNDSGALSKMMIGAINHNIKWGNNTYTNIKEPYVSSWEDLIRFMIPTMYFQFKTKE